MTHVFITNKISLISLKSPQKHRESPEERQQRQKLLSKSVYMIHQNQFLEIHINRKQCYLYYLHKIFFLTNKKVLSFTLFLRMKKMYVSQSNK